VSNWRPLEKESDPSSELVISVEIKEKVLNDESKDNKDQTSIYKKVEENYVTE
jgi:hypothetical protein